MNAVAIVYCALIFVQIAFLPNNEADAAVLSGRRYRRATTEEEATLSLDSSTSTSQSSTTTATPPVLSQETTTASLTSVTSQSVPESSSPGSPPSVPEASPSPSAESPTTTQITPTYSTSEASPSSSPEVSSQPQSSTPSSPEVPQPSTNSPPSPLRPVLRTPPAAPPSPPPSSPDMPPSNALPPAPGYTEQQLYGSVNIESLIQPYAKSEDSKVDLEATELPDTEEVRIGKTQTFDHAFPASVKEQEVVSNKQINTYTNQKHLVKITNTNIHRHHKIVNVNTKYITNILRINHPSVQTQILTQIANEHQPILYIKHTKSIK